MPHSDENHDLHGRTALVTGGGRGLGRTIALRLARRGIRTIIVGRDPSSVDETVRLANAEGLDFRGELVDISDASDVGRLAERLANEEISILVNNAGVPGPVKALVDLEVDDWDDVFAVNVRGMFLMCKAFLPPMLQREFGDVINIASVSGKRPLALRTPYCASKMAVIGLTLSLGAEVGIEGVRVNSLSPGPVRGPRMERNFRLEAEAMGISESSAEENFVSRSVLHRLVEEDEVATAVVAMLQMTGLHCADIDLSAGMVAR